jgi:hypothetical protein
MITKFLYFFAFFSFAINVFGQSAIHQSILHEKQAVSAGESSEMWVRESYGERVQASEILSLRDQNSKHFQNSDGTFTAVIAAGNVHYWENDRWNTIFHSLESIPNGIQNVTNSHKTYYPQYSSGAIQTRLIDGSEMKDMLQMRMFFEVNGQIQNPVNITSQTGSSNFNELTYSNVYGSGIDLRLTQHTTKRKMDYLVSNLNALGSIPLGADFLVFEEKVQVPTGWTAILEGNTIIILNTSGIAKLVYEKPIFKDAPQLDADGHSHSDEAEGTYAIAQSGNVLTIQTKVQLSWLANPERAFPVVIDPTVDLYPDNANWWTGHIHTNGSPAYTTTSITSGIDNVMKIGKGTHGSENNNCYHSWAKFNISSIPSACVNSVALNLNTSDNEV